MTASDWCSDNLDRSHFQSHGSNFMMNRQLMIIINVRLLLSVVSFAVMLLAVDIQVSDLCVSICVLLK